MARPKNGERLVPSKKRSDTGTKRGNYKSNLDKTGKAGKENVILNNFWKLNKVSEFMTMTQEEADKKIDEWMERFEARNIARNSTWWYPSPIIPLDKARNKRTGIDKKPKL